jgi:hypothetical protein
MTPTVVMTGTCTILEFELPQFFVPLTVDGAGSRVLPSWMPGVCLCCFREFQVRAVLGLQ